LEIDPRAFSRWERGDNLPHLGTLVKIADVLQVTLDELVGRKEPSTEVKIRNHELQQLCQQEDELPDADQQALVQVMDGLVKRAQLNKMMGKAAKG
jgi:transcriptional regulator with XRE-family HTH domain